ncbi:MAG: PDZ domain-containing protein [Planctomycetes bacterium]|nr:PDZ domain-containing protein [Planctomycetota bacterium]
MLPLLFLAPSIDGWLGIYLDNERNEAVIAEVIPDSPAARAGLQAGDELLGVGDTKTASREAFIAAIRAQKPGDRLSIQLRREGREQVVMVRLGNRPEEVPTPVPTAAPKAKPSDKPVPAVESAPPVATAPPAPAAAAGTGYLGVSLDDADDVVAVLQVLPGGPAASAGLQAGDVLLAVGATKTPTREQFRAAMQATKPGDRVSIQIRREGREQAIQVVVGARPEMVMDPGLATAPPRPERPMPAIEVVPPTPATSGTERGYLGVSLREADGAVVVDRVLDDGPAKGVLQAGDRLRRVQGKSVGGLTDLDSVLVGAGPGSKLELQVQGDSGPRTIVVTLGRRPSSAGSSAAGTGAASTAPVGSDNQVKVIKAAAPKIDTAKVVPLAPAATAPAKPAPNTTAATPAPSSAAGTGGDAARGDAELEAQLQALRSELAELRRQLEQLRQKQGRE